MNQLMPGVSNYEDNRLGKGLMKSLARKVNPEKAIKQNDQGALRSEEA